MDCVIGIDGGGTRSTGLCLDLSGRFLAQAHGGALNYHAATLEEFRQHLAQLLKALQLQVPGARILRTVIGTAALFTFATDDEIRRACADLLEPAQTCLLGDALAALYAATGGQPGLLIIAGTGSIAVSLASDKQFHTAGGFGPLIGGDPGSAFWIAGQAILAASRADPSHPLATAVRDYFRVAHLHQVIECVYGQREGSRRLAGLAEFIARGPAAPTTAFLQIQVDAGHALAALAAPLFDLAATDVVYVAGSVLQQNEFVRAALQDALERQLRRPVQVPIPALPAAAGAALLALEQTGRALTEPILQTLQTSYR